MSLELLIAANTAALEANTAALQQVLSAAAVTPVAAAAPAPKAAKTKKETPAPVVEETPAPVVKETPAPVEEAAPAPVEEAAPAPVVEEAAPFDREAAIQKITLLVRAAFTASGAGLQAKKDEYEVIRKNFAVATAKDLRDDQFADFITAVEKL